MPSVSPEALADLDRELARWGEDERTRRTRDTVGAMIRKQLQDRQRERGSLARAGLGEAQNVAARQQGWNGLYLDWSGSEVVFRRQRTQQRLGKAKIGK